MTEQEVRAALGKRAIADTRDQEELPKDRYKPFKVTDVSMDGISGSAEMFFSSDTKRLVAVNVLLSVKGPVDENSRILKRIGDDLVRQYGKPLIEMKCDSKADMALCQARWQVAGQEIALTALVDGAKERGRTEIAVCYTPLSHHKTSE